MAVSSALRALAERAGILPGYAAAGGEWRETDDAAREALLAAMGLDASSEAVARRSLEALDESERARLIDPVQVVEEGQRLRIPFRLEPERARAARFTLWISHADGRREERRLRLVSSRGRARLSAGSTALAAGEHALELRMEHPAGSRTAHQTLLVTPPRAPDVWERLGGHASFGLWANLYSLRSERSAGQGVGDLGALRRLLALAGEAGAAFVGLSPLHAVRNRGGEVSPYGPVSRLFRNPIYLDVGAVPEWPGCAEARAAGERAGLLGLERAPHIDWAGAAAGKRAVLEHLHGAFLARHAEADTERARAYRAFRRGRELLESFATFQALEDHFAAQGLARDWHAWPADFRDPGSPSVARFREREHRTVDFHAWCQFELDRQLASLAREAGAAGLRIGLYSDLAVGSLRSGFDTWAFPGLFADGVSLGAPPDDYADAGQDWGLPPVLPARLREGAYRYFRLLLRSELEHAGALRIDHALGLYRQYWVPAGRPAAEGAYVRLPVRDLLRVIALESRDRGSLVIGEDLGTVPRGLAALLARHGVLSTRVLLFERDARGRFRPAARYSKRALVTAHTHDHPPLAGYWQGRDLDLRRKSGAIASDAALREARARRERECRALERRLGGSARAGATPDAAALRREAYGFLARTPSPLVGVSVDDLAGETEPVNLPGVPQERFASWTRRMRDPVERVVARQDARAILAALSGRSSRGT